MGHMHVRRVWVIFAVLLAAFSAPRLARADSSAGVEFFEARVRPVLVEHCYTCHAADSKKLKAGLRLDSASGLSAGGESGAVIVPGDPAASRLIHAITYDQPDLQMPPKAKLSDQQIADLTQWVKLGAPMSADVAGTAAAKAKGFDLQQRKRDHWAWQLVRVTPPAPLRQADWPADPLDAYVLANLEKNGLAPAPATDKRAWIRRVTFDLIGLPPTPLEVQAFLEDGSPKACEKVVDRLLASPHFGERWARHWMDLVRYAETRGHEFDYEIPGASEYRDYLIRAFNVDLPYDQFVREHIAGDLLPNPRRDEANDVNESVIATGFWHFGEWLHSPVDIRLDEADRVDNQIDVLGKAFLGMTIACARCHDHKFDAISTKDYYSLVGYLHSSSYRDVAFKYQRGNAKVIRRLADCNATARSALRSGWASACGPAINESADVLLGYRSGEKPGPNGDLATVAAWAEAIQIATTDPASPMHLWAKLALDAEAQQPDRFKAAAERIATEILPRKDASKLASDSKCVVDYSAVADREWITDGSAFGDAPLPAGTFLPVDEKPARGAPAYAILSEAAAHSAALGPHLPGMLRTPTFVISEPKLWLRVAGSGQAFIAIDSHRLVAGPLHGVSRQAIRGGPDFTWKDVDLGSYIGQRAHVEFTAAADEWVAVGGVWQGSPTQRDTAGQTIARRVLADPPTCWAGLAQRYQSLFLEAAQDAGPGDSTALASVAAWLSKNPDLFPIGFEQARSIDAAAKAFLRDRAKIAADFRQSPTTAAMLDGSGVDEHVFLRGSPKTPGELAPRRFLEAISGSQTPAELRGSGRLALADQISSPANPLTARVMVNRIWHHLIGRGIVASTDNFGVLGERPSNPELLDYLADRFVREGWSVKKMVRAVVLSSTYRMASVADVAAEQTDPGNIQLHRANLRRLEAEEIRDAMLAVSGTLDQTLFGTSTEVYLTPFMEGRGRPAQSGALDGGGRRSVYVKVRRNFLSPMMLAFDTPAPASAMGRRSVSNVPAQALCLLNDPFVIQEASRWAASVAKIDTHASAIERIELMYQIAFARPATSAERDAACEFIHQQSELFKATGKPPQDADTAAWADLAHVLFNAKEFIFLN